MGLLWWEVILALYLCFILVFGLISLIRDDTWWFNSTPKDIYNNTKFNWFGCYFLWFLEFLCLPHIWISIWLAVFIKWLFTVGRKD